MSTFIESPRFPDFIAYWAVGGRGFNTTIVTTLGGQEFRNANWSQSRGKWNIADAFVSAKIGAAGASYNHITLIEFFRASQGQLYGFRFKDFRDYTDDGNGVFASLGAGSFQMYKQYSLSPNTGLQIIQKPVSGTVVVTGGSGVSIDYTTGIVTCTGTPTSWTGQYDIPVRFADDFPNLGPDPSGSINDWQSLNLMEIRDIS